MNFEIRPFHVVPYVRIKMKSAYEKSPLKRRNHFTPYKWLLMDGVLFFSPHSLRYVLLAEYKFHFAAPCGANAGTFNARRL